MKKSINREDIVKMWEEGLSGSQIADKLKITRNAVIGVIHRIRQSGVLLRGQQERPQKEKKQKPNRDLRKDEIIIRHHEPEATPDYYYDAGEYNTNMSGLKYYSCRFIVKDGSYDEAIYCGSRIHRASYCKDHYKICYYSPRTRIKDLRE